MSNYGEYNKKRDDGIDHKLVQWAYDNLKLPVRGENYEKMISGLPYDSYVASMIVARSDSSEKAIDYQNIRRKQYPSLEEFQKARRDAIGDIFGKIGSKCWVEYPFFVDYGSNVKVGENFYANFNATFLDCSIIDIGDNVMLGPNVTITTVGHPTKPEHRLAGELKTRPIKIGNNVWLASNCVILPGVTIGDHSVIAAGAIVARDVPDSVVVAGIPARIVKHL